MSDLKINDTEKTIEQNWHEWYFMSRITSQSAPFQPFLSLMQSLRGKPQSIMFLGFKSFLSQQAAGN
jgi:hypothetical protein